MEKTPLKDFQRFKSSVKTLSLATLNNDGEPAASYAPFVCDDTGKYYIFVSQLASHTQDLISHPRASILLMEDEQDTRQLFARQRISYQCNIETVAVGSEQYAEILSLFEKRFGNIIELLRSLPDFILFKLVPQRGRYVQGFAKAFELTGENLDELEHIDS